MSISSTLVLPTAEDLARFGGTTLSGTIEVAVRSYKQVSHCFTKMFA